MTLDMDFPRIEAALALLGDCSPEAQLVQLKNLCENNGVWTVPDDASSYSPVLFEISLFGVPAISDRIEELPKNWQRAARNVLTNLDAAQ